MFNPNSLTITVLMLLVEVLIGMLLSKAIGRRKLDSAENSYKGTGFIFVALAVMFLAGTAFGTTPVIAKLAERVWTQFGVTLEERIPVAAPDKALITWEPATRRLKFEDPRQGHEWAYNFPTEPKAQTPQNKEAAIPDRIKEVDVYYVRTIDRRPSTPVVFNTEKTATP